jgi:hypothetical protein
MRQIVLTTSDASGGTKTSAVAPLDIHGRPQISLQLDVTGTATCTVQQTLDNVFDLSITPTWFDHPDTNLVGATVDRQGNYAFVPAAVRLVQTAGAGSAKLTIIQSGILG